MRLAIIKVVGGTRYNTETATEIAGSEYWDGSNHDRSWTTAHLYRTLKGAYFMAYSTTWHGGRARIEVLTEAEARNWYEQLPIHQVGYVDAFPSERRADQPGGRERTGF